MTIIIILAWLVFGYLFTFWFVNYFLDDRKFNDGYEIGPGMLLWLTLLGPGMAIFMAVIGMVDILLNHTGPFIKRFYGFPKEN